MKNKIIPEYGYLSLNHVGEQLCGDSVAVVQPDDDTQILVLADGMGSGVKANILSTLTATMMSTLLANNVDFDDCVETILSTLPVCKDRNASYCTFTAVQVSGGRHVQIYNYDNPEPFIIHNGKSEPLYFLTGEICGKQIDRVSFEVQPGDCIIMMSDGCIHAGAGVTLNYGWEIPQIMKFMQANFRADASAKYLATLLTGRCNALYEEKPADDTTCAVVRIRERCQVNVMYGPPGKHEDDEKAAAFFFGLPGKHIICGGTTAKVAARYLGKELIPDNVNMDETIPPMTLLDGADLVTEGILTLQRVSEYAADYLDKNRRCYDWAVSLDGASLIACALFEEATDIHFLIGSAVNSAHQEGKSLGYQMKQRTVENLMEQLKKMNKNVTATYF